MRVAGWLTSSFHGENRGSIALGRASETNGLDISEQAFVETYGKIYGKDALGRLWTLGRPPHKRACRDAGRGHPER